MDNLAWLIDCNTWHVSVVSLSILLPCFNIARWCINCLSFVAFLCPDFGCRMFQMFPLQVPILYQPSKSDHSILYLFDAHPRMMIPVIMKVTRSGSTRKHRWFSTTSAQVCLGWGWQCSIHARGGVVDVEVFLSGAILTRDMSRGGVLFLVLVITPLKTTVTNIPWKSENWWLEDESSSFWYGLFSGAMLVLGRVVIAWVTCNFHSKQRLRRALGIFF